MFGYFWVIYIENMWKYIFLNWGWHYSASSSNLMDQSPENPDVQDYRIFGTPRNPYLWILIYKMTLKNPRKAIISLGNMISWTWHLELWNFWNFGILESWNHETRNFEFWNLETLKMSSFEILKCWSRIIPRSV